VTPPISRNALPQKLSDPLLLPYEQHKLSDVSVQSAFVLHKRRTWVPLHWTAMLVGHALGAVHATMGVPVQFGTVPPSM
jgi:hypothetical protein